MTELRRLEPHDPLPEGGSYLLVLRRFAEDAPAMTIVELISADGHSPPTLSIQVRPDGTPMDFEESVQAARKHAADAGVSVVYAVDRAAGRREREVLAHRGDHTTGMAGLSDTFDEANEPGTDVRDRPRDAGSNLTPRR